MRKIHKEIPEFYQKNLRTEQPKSWEKVTCRNDMRIYMLYKEQSFQCAYSETRIEPEFSHIDHFVKQSFINQGYFKPLTVFSWENLFTSCNSEYYGAKFKDKNIKIDDYKLLINPSLDESSLYFEYSWTGEILAISHNEKALKTIELFNLNDFALVEQRKVVALQVRLIFNLMTLADLINIFGQFESMICYFYKQLTSD